MFSRPCTLRILLSRGVGAGAYSSIKQPTALGLCKDIFLEEKTSHLRVNITAVLPRSIVYYMLDRPSTSKKQDTNLTEEQSER
jgi:hypothetical protein